MSVMNKYTKMLESVGARYTKEVSGDKVSVIVPTSQGGNVETVFSYQGEYFYTSSFKMNGSASSDDSRGQSTSSKDDYAELLLMISTAPEQRGEFFEAESQDGKYIGIIYYDYDADYGTAFVCSAETKQFLGVVGC